MKLFRTLKEIDRLERKHRREQLLVDVAIVVVGFTAGGLIMWALIWLTR